MHMMQSAPLFSLYASNIFFRVVMRREICVAMEFMKNAFKLIFRMPFTHSYDAKHTNMNRSFDFFFFIFSPFDDVEWIIRLDLSTKKEN